VLSVEYDDDGFWPLAADGFGRSLVPADAAGDPDRPESWRASAAAGGSPGAADPQPAVRGGVVVNEVLARAAAPLEGAVELYNPTSAAVNIGGWYLSDRRDDEASLRKHRIAAGASVPAGGYLVIYEQQFNASPGSPGSFALDPRGGGVYLAAADGAGNLTGYITGAEFGAAEPGVSSGTHLNSAGRRDFVPLSERSFGADSAASVEEFRGGKGKVNALPRVGPVVLNELAYHPPEGEEEFVELNNLSAEAVPLHDAALGRGWRVEGVLNAAGVESFEFSAGAEIPARGYLLLVAVDPAAFRSRYGIPVSVPVHGPYGGALDNGGEWVRLERPLGFGVGEVSYAPVDAVRYNDRLPWAEEPDGGGATLERVAASLYGNDALNWDASRVAGGTPGGLNSVSEPGENQPPVAFFGAEPPSGPAPLLVRLDASASFDPDGSIASYEWDFGDGRSGAGRTLSHEYTAAGTYTVVLRVTDDRGARSAASRLVMAEEAPVGGGQLPGDVTQDGLLDISDAAAVLGHLFLGTPPAMPCAGGTIENPGNLALADSNGDGGIDIADAVYVLVHLFLGGEPPALGTQCVRIAGCPEVCSQ
jgi:hypothetical protein